MFILTIKNLKTIYKLNITFIYFSLYLYYSLYLELSLSVQALALLFHFESLSTGLKPLGSFQKKCSWLFRVWSIITHLRALLSQGDVHIATGRFSTAAQTLRPICVSGTTTPRANILTPSPSHQR